MEIDPIIKEKIDAAKEEVRHFLPAADDLTDEQGREILRRYAAAIQGNFVNWMAGAAVSARSIQARFAAEENIYVEIKDNHTGMLRRFAAAANAEAQTEHYTYVAGEVEQISSMVANMSGAESIGLMASLENTSAVFIPFLSDVAKKLGSTDFTYTDVHGDADIEHADQFLWALTHEQHHHPDFDQQLERAIAHTVRLLKKIFLI